MEELFEQFLQEKIYLKNVTNRTVGFYRQSFTALKKHGGQLSKEGLNQFIITMRQSGISPVTCNTYIRGVNSLLTWLYENNHTTERLRAKQLKEEKKVIKIFSDSQLRLLVSYKPKGVYESRLHTLVCLLIDTGIRIEEALTLERVKVNLEDLLITVHGKGNKERTIPISLECRKVLFKYMRDNQSSLVFCTRHGDRLSYFNILRDFKKQCAKLGITGVRASFHTLRHGFALNYVRSGGSLFHLQKALGHTTLQMTRRYTELQTDDLSLMHRKTSLLSRLR